MSRDTLPKAVIEALQATGATEEMIAAARVAFVAYEDGYRAKAAARQRACRARKRHVTRNEASQSPIESVTDAIDASHGNVDPDAHIATILALIEQGCDLEADILPVIA
jgi:hypothetical protein